jgi:putative ABC transport system substrate-binding protein
MRRREFIKLLGGGAAVWPLAAHAQQPTMPVIGYLRSASLADSMNLVTAFRQGLKESGYVEGQNVAIEYRWADNQIDRLPALATDLVGRKVAVIVANQVSTPAAKASTATIPIVFVIGGDPIKLGFVTSLSRPDGNVTGVTFLTDTLEAKRLEVLRELVPRTAVMAALVNSNNQIADALSRDVQEAARVIGVQLHVASVSSERDFEPAFATLVQKQVGALVITGDALHTSRREQLVALAARYAIPTIYSEREFVTVGGLLMGPARRTPIGMRGPTSRRFSRAPSPRTCRSGSRPSSSWSPISRPQRRSVSSCRCRSKCASAR